MTTAPIPAPDTENGPQTPARRVSTVEAATLVLETEHSPAVTNNYGACTRAGFHVSEGPDRKARIHYRFPNLNILDPDRVSSRDRWRISRANVNVYALTLAESGWTVEHKTVTTGAILLASPPPTVDQANEMLWAAVNALRADGQTIMAASLARPVAYMLEGVIGEEHGPADRPLPSSDCHSCGGTGNVYAAHGEFTNQECCCDHAHCRCGTCDAFPCERVQQALAIARAVTAAGTGR